MLTISTSEQPAQTFNHCVMPVPPLVTRSSSTFFEALCYDFLATYTSGTFRANTVMETSFFLSNMPILLIVTGNSNPDQS